jgi:hypothetical protein
MILNPLEEKERVLAKLLRKTYKRGSDTLSADDWQYGLIEAAAYTGNESILRFLDKFNDLEEDQDQGEDFYGFSSPRRGDINGSLRLGVSLPEKYPFGLSPDQINRNVFVQGIIGHGKTNSLVKLHEGLYDQGIPFLSVSTAKKDMRHLIRYFPDIQVIKAKDLRFNLLEKNEWSQLMMVISDTIEIFSQEIDLMLRSKSVLTDALKKTWETFGNVGPGVNPTIEDMLDLLNEKRHEPGFKRDDFVLKLIQRIEMLLFLSGDLFRCSTGHKLEKLLEYPVVLELDDFSDSVTNLLMIALLWRILRYRVEKGVRGELQHVIIIDEAKRVLNRVMEKSVFSRVPQIVILISIARDLGEGIVAADQQVSLISDTFLSCSCTKIAFHSSGKDTQETARIFGLSSQQTSMLHELPKGVAIIKQDEGHPKPFLVKMDKIEFQKDVTDKEVEAHSRKFREWLDRDVQPRSTVIIEKLKLNTGKRLITKDEEIFLCSIARNPFLTITERFRALGLTNYLGGRLIKSLNYKGFLKKMKILTGKRGSQPVLLQVTDKGTDYLRKNGIKIQARGKGGIVHQWWQKKIEEFYQSTGKEAVVEPNIDGVNADVLVIDANGKRVAIEVALSLNGQLENIQRDLKYFDRIIMAAETKPLMDKIVAASRSALGQEELKKVRFCLLGDFLS